ncbi:MAG: hypothetical protein KKI08_15250 [Armatimonadetes bacterium]|nr:hypothetical protein [Armatimonadota bacterium]
MGLRLPQPAALFGIMRPVNVAALAASLPQSPCRPAEMSPGNWVGFDCTAPSIVTRALSFTRPHGFATAGLPPGIDQREAGMEGPIKSQGAVGACTAMSLSTAMEHELRRMAITEPISALHVWSQYAVPQMGTAGDSNLDKALSADAVWPYDPATACKMMRRSFDSCGSAYGVSSNSADGDAVIQAAKNKADGTGRYQLIGIERLTSTDPDEIAGIIAGGSDVWVAFNVNTAAWQSKSMVGGVIQDYSETESTGHAVVLAGYRTAGAQRQFLIHNSWGPGWGVNGYGWISESMVRTQLRYAYRVRVANPNEPGGTTPPGGNPPGGTPPGADGCPPGQVRDIVYGQCMPACPSGQPPAAGLCVPSFPGLPPPTQPPASGSCPAGQAPDVMNGQCAPLCAGGLPAIGGLCLPHVQ